MKNSPPFFFSSRTDSYKQRKELQIKRMERSSPRIFIHGLKLLNIRKALNGIGNNLFKWKGELHLTKFRTILLKGNIIA